MIKKVAVTISILGCVLILCELIARYGLGLGEPWA